MKIICVGGNSSNCGKTSVAILLSKVFPNWAAIKVTPSRPADLCPRGHDCGACHPPDGPYEIIADHEILAIPGTDTARYLEAGISRVLWIRSLPEFLLSAMEAALFELSDAPGVIIESTTAIPLLNGLNILTIRGGIDQIKESARRCIHSVNLVALNMREGKALPIYVVGKRMGGLGRTARIIPMCATLGPEASVNKSFVEACKNALLS